MSKNKNIREMKFIEGKDLTLDKFVDVLLSKWGRLLVPNCHFPTDEMLDEFLTKIKQKTDTEVKDVLRAFFIKNSTYGKELFYKQIYEGMDFTDPNLPATFAKLSEKEYFRRLMSHKRQSDTVWEGITWVLDLLPHFPNEALRALDAYFLANCQFLPDDLLVAFGDWTAIIRAKYVDAMVPQETFLSLQPKEFEYLVADLYEHMGYAVEVTKSSYDGGIDVIAEKKKTGKKEKLLIQCKRYKNKVNVDEARKLLGVVSDLRATKGVLITSTEFTREAKKFSNSNPRIELIDISALTHLLNLHLGPLWPVKVDKYILNQKQK